MRRVDSITAWILVGGVMATSAMAQDWVTFADETATRLSAATGLGTSDPEEKDLISGDVDRDGDFDMIVARKVPFSTPGGKRNVLFLNINGVMTDQTSTLAPDFLDETDDRDVVLVDVNNDSWLDVVTVTTFAEQPRLYMNLGEDGSGVWLGFDYQPADNRLPTFSPAPQFCAVGFGDVTGDERPDLFFVDYSNGTEDRLLINDGAGFFTDETSLRMTEDMSSSSFGTDGHIVDLNDDGWNDIVKCNTLGGPGVEAIYNDGTGSFDFMETIDSSSPYMIETGDFTNDGVVDVFVVGDGQDLSKRNLGNDAQDHAEFSSDTVTNSPNTSGLGGNVKLADMNNDGLLDALIADVDTDFTGCDRQFTMLRANGTPPNITFSDPFNGADRNFTREGVFDIEAIDINGDGRLDLWIGACDGNHIFINTTPVSLPFVDGFESGNLSAWDATEP